MNWKSVARLFVIVFGVALLSSLVAPRRALAACKVYDDMVAARKDADDAFKEYHAVKLDPAIDVRLGVLAGIMELDYDLTLNDLKALGKSTLSADEKKAFGEYLQKRKQARQKLDAANAAARKAEQAWRDKFNKKEELLDNADKIFREEQAFVQSERRALDAMTVDSLEYLDRASKLTERLKTSYAGIKANLDPYRDCFADVNALVTDIERRLERIKQVDEEIARRRAAPPPGVPGVTTLHPDRPADVKLKPGVTAPDNTDQNGPPPAPADPNADIWVMKGQPEVRVLKDSKNLITSKDVNGVSWKVTSDDGSKTGTATVKITKAPKARLAAGEAVELIMSASAQDPAWASGGWYAEYFGGVRAEASDNGGNCRSWVEQNSTPPAKPTGVWHYHFYVPDGATERHVEARLGRPVGNGVDDPSIWIVWTYVREGGK